MALLIFVLLAYITMQQTSGATHGCQQVAECESGLGYVHDLHEETEGTVVVSGYEGLARCQLTGGQGQVIQGPWGSDSVQSVLVTDDGDMWAVAWYALDGRYHLYRQDTAGTWHKVLGKKIKQPFVLDKQSNGHILVLSDIYRAIYYVQPTPQPTLVSTLNLKPTVTWDHPYDLAVLPSGSVAVTDYRNVCVHIVLEDGTLENTIGTCGSIGSALGQLDYPKGICTDNDGNILIADKGNNRISVYSSTDSPITTICQGELKRPTAVLVTSSGHLVVGQDDGKVRVFKYDN